MGADVLIQHEGPVDHAVVEDLLARTERICLDDGAPVAVRKRLFNVLVEALENLHHHAREDHRAAAWASLLCSPGAYHVLIGNPAPLTTATLLEHRLGVINEMDEDDLKQHYMLLLSNDGRTERGGAGLGLLTMARKSQRPIRLTKEVCDPVTALLVMEIVVPR